MKTTTKITRKILTGNSTYLFYDKEFNEKDNCIFINNFNNSSCKLLKLCYNNKIKHVKCQEVKHGFQQLILVISNSYTELVIIYSRSCYMFL